MTSDKLPADTTTSGSDAVAENGESKVLKFDESNLASPAKDINTKITALDTDLAHLRAELSAINGSVEEGLDRLGDTDTDLTAKVSETNAAYLRGFAILAALLGYASLTQPTKTCYPTAFGYFRRCPVGRVSEA